MNRARFRPSIGGHAILRDRGFDVGRESCGVPADALLAGGPDRRVRVVDLLRHGADEAGKVRRFALQESLAKVHVGQQPIERIRGLVIGRCGEDAEVTSLQVIGRRQSQFLLAVEVVEEASLGQFRRLADVLDPCWPGGRFARITCSAAFRSLVLDSCRADSVLGAAVFIPCIKYVIDKHTH